jgi:tetratricopeptide (TPR) repeat protein
VRSIVIALSVTLGLVLLESRASAQALVLKDGSRLLPEQFAVENGKAIKKVKVGNNVATSPLQLSTVDRMEWPRPEELVQASDMMAAGKTKEALEVLAKGRAFFEPFKDINGNWYSEIALAQLEAMSSSDDFTAALKALTEAQRLKLTEEQKLRLKIIKLNIDRQASSDYAGIVAQAENILAESTDSSVGASVWMIIGDVYTKQKDFEKALMAYLHVPVFYGTQVQKVPEAELAAARTLVKMRRFEDATGYFTRLAEAYQGSGIAETANKEKAGIGGLKNDEGGTGAPPAAEAAKPTDGAAAAPATENKPAEAAPPAK